ncbi:MAG: hypothetical protein WKF76_05740 [Nocardioidaceae bacterium]
MLDQLRPRLGLHRRVGGASALALSGGILRPIGIAPHLLDRPGRLGVDAEELEEPLQARHPLCDEILEEQHVDALSGVAGLEGLDLVDVVPPVDVGVTLAIPELAGGQPLLLQVESLLER